MQRRLTCRRLVVLGVLGLLLGTAARPQPAAPPRVLVEPDGAVHMPAQVVPVFGFLTPEGKAYLAEHLRNLQRPELLVQEDGVPPLLAGFIARQRELFPVDRGIYGCSAGGMLDGHVRCVVPATWPAAAGRHRHSVLRRRERRWRGVRRRRKLHDAAARRRPRAPRPARPAIRCRWSISRAPTTTIRSSRRRARPRCLRCFRPR